MSEDNRDEQAGRKRLSALLDEVKEEVQILKEKAGEDIRALKEPEKTQLYKSVFRVKHDEKPRSRALGILSNVFLHLHPAKINRDAVRLQLYLGNGWHHFLPLHRADIHRRALDVLLPSHEGSGFQRHSLSRARRALRQAAAEHASLGGALDGDHGLVAYVSGLLDRFLQEAERVQLVPWASF